MKLVNVDIGYLFLIFLTSIVFVFDLFFNIGRSANGDGLIHTVVPTLFAKAITEGNIPVGWTDGFANYGLPLGTVSQQLTTYLTAFFSILSHNPVLGFNCVVFLGVFLSCVFFYLFLRIYYSAFYSFMGIFIFQFTPYRILNVYIRGALPEFFADVFFPLLLIASYLMIVKKNIYGFFLFVFSFTLLTLTHPFMDIVAMFIIVPYVVFLCASQQSLKEFGRKIFRYSIRIIIAMIFGVLLASYYIIPLLFEIKYFYYGQGNNHLTPNNYLTLKNFFFYSYPYFTKLDILNRGFFVNVGTIESIIFILGIFYFLYMVTVKKIRIVFSLFYYSLLVGALCIFMLTHFSDVLYAHINLLSNIQFPWRILSAFIFVPPILLSYFLSKINKKTISFLLVILIAFVAFPQLYGKNYTIYPNTFYSFTPYNLDAVVMNTIWTGNSTSYPVTQTKASIISGKGYIQSQSISDSKRIYTVFAQSQVRMVDRTFYFPGWKVFIDGINTIIEYQDPLYRGVITYLVPPGKHTILITYTDTKVRLLGKILSGISIVSFGVLFFLRKRLKNLLV